MRRLEIIVPSCLLVVFIFSIKSSDGTLKDIYSWDHFDFQFPNEEERQDRVYHRFYDPQKINPLDFAVWRDKLFLSLGYSEKVQLTLAYVSLNDSSGTQSPELIPYPDYDTNNAVRPIESKLIWVEKIHVDTCDRLWMVDEEFVKRRPRIVVYDLKTDQLIRTHEINYGRGLQSIVVDVTEDNCNQAFVYVLYDTGRVTVYDFENDESWKSNLRLKLARNQIPPEGCRRYSLLNTAEFEDATLLATQADGHRALYFRGSSTAKSGGIGEFSISSKVLRTKPDSDNPTYLYEVLGCTDWIFSSVFDEKSELVFQTNNSQAITCWKSIEHEDGTFSKTSGSFYTIHETDAEIKGIKVDKDGNLWILSSRPVDSPDPDQFSYKISTLPATEIVRKTDCDKVPVQMVSDATPAPSAAQTHRKLHLRSIIFYVNVFTILKLSIKHF